MRSRATSRTILDLVGLIFIVVAAYILAVGPLNKLDQHKLLPPAAISLLRVAYAPLNSLCGKSARFDALMLWYVKQVWRVPDKRREDQRATGGTSKHKPRYQSGNPAAVKCQNDQVNC